MTDLISATLIYDGEDIPRLPQQLMPAGKSEDDGLAAIKQCGQFTGTPLERLCETAARACYDSAGRGRNSADMHKHILEVKHLSVLEHATFTVEWTCSQARADLAQFPMPFVSAFLNRPSLFVRMVNRMLPAPGRPNGLQHWYVRATVNLRHLLEWNTAAPQYWSHLGAEMARLVHPLAPQIIPAPSADSLPPPPYPVLVEPETDDEKWVTMLLTGSRGFSHELVRHGDWTAISQRSTRYVDESESMWVEHPLLTARFEDSIKSFATIDPDTRGQLRQEIVVDAQGWYKRAVESLEPWLIARGVDKVSARKQARGAARGYLGNALYTEVVFSANLAQWKRMLRQRLNAAADAEIRQCFAGVLRELQRCRYADRFTGWTTAPSPDGIGEVLVEPT